jgi:hypothetical protein
MKGVQEELKGVKLEMEGMKLEVKGVEDRLSAKSSGSEQRVSERIADSEARVVARMVTLESRLSAALAVHLRRVGLGTLDYPGLVDSILARDHTFVMRALKENTDMLVGNERDIQLLP